MISLSLKKCLGLGSLSYAILLLVGCGGGVGDGAQTQNGTFTLAITDAPVDDVMNVFVEFTAVTLKPRAGQEISFEFDPPEQVDLKTLEGEKMVTLLDHVTVPAGAYNWVQLHVNGEFDGQDMSGTYVIDAMGQHDLRIPSGSQSGLRLVSGFTITVNQNTNFVIDWDLRKGLTNPIGQPGYFLKPALRITDLTEYGSISGTVPEVMAGCDPLIYVYEGSDVAPEDMGSPTEPLTTATVAQDPNNASAWSYSVTFLSPMVYTVAYTCDALADDPDVDDAVMFLAAQIATVEDGQDTRINF